MPSVIYVPSRVGEGHFTDFQSPAVGATDNGKFWAWNSGTSKFEPMPNVVCGGSSGIPLIVSGSDVYVGKPSLQVKGTPRNALERYALLEIYNPIDSTTSNKYDGSATLQMRAGATANQPRYIHFRQYDNTVNNWIWGVNSGDSTIFYDANSLTHRIWMESSGGNGDSWFAAAGTGKIRLNYHSNDTAGTGGLDIYSGGAVASNKVIQRSTKDDSGNTFWIVNAENGLNPALKFQEALNDRWTLRYNATDNGLQFYDDITSAVVMSLYDNGRTVFGDGTTPYHIVNVISDADPVMHISANQGNLTLAAALDLMENSTGFGVAGSFGFRLALNGSTNIFSISSGNGTTITERLTMTRDTGLTGFGATTPTAKVDIAASTTAAASLRIRSGTPPTSPNDGDIWYPNTGRPTFRRSTTSEIFATGVQATGGAATATASYTSTEQTMLQKVYDAARTFGLLS